MIESTDLSRHFLKLKKPLRPLFYAHFSDVYKCHLVAAYSKCFEFNLLVNKTRARKEAAFYTSTLRGICEDLITLTFLKKQSTLDKDKILLNLMRLQLQDLIAAQSSFFKKNHSQQIVLDKYSEPDPLNDPMAILRDEWAKIGLNKEKISPSVSHMATDAGLIELYQYLYAATSDMVHFSPHNLLRSGWSKKLDGNHNFSPLNFANYFNQFNRFYGAFLFVKFSQEFRKELKLDKETYKAIGELDQVLRLNSRWPELVTFEEMNVKDADVIRLENAVRKIRLTAAEFGIQPDEIEELVKKFVQARQNAAEVES